MGLIQELTRYWELKYDKDGILLENKMLKNKVAQLQEERDNFEIKAHNLEETKKMALDEIVQNQKRIDALLRQLSEKNGGKQR